ncbi:hypothetical protein POHY109586_15235 [Polaromonas hydrogenivorans]
MTRKSASKAQNSARPFKKMRGFFNPALQATRHQPPRLPSALELPELPAEVPTGLPDLRLPVEPARLTAVRDDGWQLTVDGVNYAPTAEPNVLGTLVWALQAEAAFDNLGFHGNRAITSLAQHWCGMLQRHAEGHAADELPLELEQDALACAAALAPDATTRECLLRGYARRKHELVPKKINAGLIQKAAASR